MINTLHKLLKEQSVPCKDLELMATALTHPPMLRKVI